MNCPVIERVPIRAIISVSGYETRTPFIKSFSVESNRGQLYNTFSCTVEVPASATFSTGSSVEISAGEKGDEERIFTGRIRRITINPTFDKPGYFLLNLNGASTLIDLEKKRYSRRLKALGFSMFVSITGGPKNRPNMGFSMDKQVVRGEHTYTSPSLDPGKGELSPLIKTPERGNSKKGERSKIDPLSGSNRKGEGGDEDLSIHDHSSITKGGPAFGVFAMK